LGAAELTSKASHTPYGMSQTNYLLILQSSIRNTESV